MRDHIPTLRFTYRRYSVVLVLSILGPLSGVQTVSSTTLKHTTNERTTSTTSTPGPGNNDGDDDDNNNSQDDIVDNVPFGTSSRRNLAPLQPAIECSSNTTAMVDFSIQSLTEINPLTLVQYIPGSGPYCLTLQDNLITRILDTAFTYGAFNRMISLNLNNNFISSIEPGAFGSLNSTVPKCTSLCALYLWNNRLSSLPSDFLSGTSITVLDLTANDFYTLPTGVVSVTRASVQLTTLSVARNYLTLVDLDALDGLNFSQLILSENQISFVAYTDTTPIANRIILLDVSNNNLSVIPTVFGCILNLYVDYNVGITELGGLYCDYPIPEVDDVIVSHSTSIDVPSSPNTSTPGVPSTQCLATSGRFLNFITFSVRGCSISRISSSTFQYAHPMFVHELDFSNNSITMIEPGAFACVPTLRNLILSENSLTRVDSAMFGAAQVHYLDVSFNHITSIQKDALPTPTSLISCIFDGNRISTISPYAFQLGDADNEHLVSIHLAKNWITEIPSSAFAGCSAVTDLNLAANRLTILTRSLFDDMPRLSVLNVAENLIAEFDPDASFLMSGSLVSHLDLSGNRLSMVSQSWTASLQFVRTLNLADNFITFIETDAFNALCGVVTLDLQLNDIALIRPEVPNSVFTTR